MRPTDAETRLTRSAQGERGSIPLALLAVIVASGLTLVVTASVLAGERSVRFDQGYTGSVHVAEAGIQYVIHKLNTGQLEASDSPASGSGELSGQSYSWTAEKIDDHEWRVRSQGESDFDVQRTLEALVRDEPLFNLAAFTDQVMDFAGSNFADSYRSTPGDQAWCTGWGRVGSNDRLEFSGASSSGTCDYEVSHATVDGVDLHDWDDNPGWPDTTYERCDHAGGGAENNPNNCRDGSEPLFETFPEPIDVPAMGDWINDITETCETDGSFEPLWRSSEQTTEIAPAGDSNPELFPEAEESPNVHCVGTLEFDEHTTVTSDASPENPVVFVVQDAIIFDRGEGAGQRRVAVNCEGCSLSGGFNPADDELYPQAAALQIYTASDTNPQDGSSAVMRATQHSRIAAAIYAPKGDCREKGGSGAGVHIFGSLICKSVNNQGGWQFHYDEDLQGHVRTGEYAVDQLSEH